jgi:hypothetical protein
MGCFEIYPVTYMLCFFSKYESWIQSMGCFEIYSVTFMLCFFSKYECWVTDIIMPLYHFIFLGCQLSFCIARFHNSMECKKQFM